VYKIYLHTGAQVRPKPFEAKYFKNCNPIYSNTKIFLKGPERIKNMQNRTSTGHPGCTRKSSKLNIYIQR
jgi:hypothetical protein